MKKLRMIHLILFFSLFLTSRSYCDSLTPSKISSKSHKRSEPQNDSVLNSGFVRALLSGQNSRSYCDSSSPKQDIPSEILNKFYIRAGVQYDPVLNYGVNDSVLNSGFVKALLSCQNRRSYFYSSSPKQDIPSEILIRFYKRAGVQYNPVLNEDSVRDLVRKMIVSAKDFKELKNVFYEYIPTIFESQKSDAEKEEEDRRALCTMEDPEIALLSSLELEKLAEQREIELEEYRKRRREIFGKKLKFCTIDFKKISAWDFSTRRGCQ